MTSCGVVVTDGARLLLGHATGSPRWDIPKGLAEPGEAFAAAAARELQEETGLEVQPEALEPLGVHVYLRGKDLALFACRVEVMPEPGALRCASMVTLRNGRVIPEMDRFGVFAWDPGLALVGRNMARVLGTVRASAGWA